MSDVVLAFCSLHKSVMIWLIQQKCNCVSVPGLDQISIAVLSSSVQDEYHGAWNHSRSRALPRCIFIAFAMIGLGMKGSIVKCRSSLANFRVYLLKLMSFTGLLVLGMQGQAGNTALLRLQ